ncbi:MAG: hypothetical protein ACFCGT_14645 [Sandaracinaceae bacterium]
MGRVLTAAAALAVLGATFGLPMRGDALDEGRRVARVLFVGNSYTTFNDLPRMVARLSRSVPDGTILDTDRAVHGGYSLRLHWRRSGLQERVAAGGFDAVVLQGHSTGPLRRPDEMATYARRISRLVHQVGGGVVLMQTWARGRRSGFYRDREHHVRSPSQMEAQLHWVYGVLARDVGATLSPVGHAWLDAQRSHPRIPLHRADHTHPGLAGTYLAACTLYGTLTGRDPRGATWRPYPLSAAAAAALRATAFRTLADPRHESLPGQRAWGSPLPPRP